MSIDCILNPNTDIYDNLTQCGIQIVIDKTLIVSEPDIIILLRGTVYNRLHLCRILEIDVNNSSEQVIIHMYKRFGIDYLLQVLDGVFTFILFDYDYKNDISKVFVVKDLFGIIPIFTIANHKSIAFSTCVPLNINTNTSIMQKEPFGSYTMYELGPKVLAKWQVSNIMNRSYFTVPYTNMSNGFSSYIYLFSKCIKRIILKNDNIPDRIADFIVKRLFENIHEQQMIDIDIYDDTTSKIIQYSPINFFEIQTNESMFEYDVSVRTQLYNADFSQNKKYPFFDKDFVSLYFSIPLRVRYTRHEDLFLIE